MAMGDALRRRMEELAARQPQIAPRLSAIAQGATLRAVEAAVERTPPNDGGLRGVNMISGELAQHWATDSRVTPVQSGDTFVTTLENDRQYASYVNDGHRLDKHFVPGLYIDDSGLLSRDLSRDVGMVVGTKTTYVPGVYMKEAGVDKYEEVAETELRKLAGEVLR